MLMNENRLLRYLLVKLNLGYYVQILSQTFKYSTAILVKTMRLECPVLERGNRLPVKYTCKGKGISPPLSIIGIPEGTQSMVIIMLDPDAPLKTFIHWLLYDIPPDIDYIEENEKRYKQGRNSLFGVGYFPPCPVGGEHRYIFTVYAIDKKLNLKEKSTFWKVKKVVRNHIIQSAELVTFFKK